VLDRILADRLRPAVAAVLPDANLDLIQVRPCPDPKFGDYQAAALMTLARERKMNPRQLATDVLARLDVAQWCDQVEIAGAGLPGFKRLFCRLQLLAGLGNLFIFAQHGLDFVETRAALCDCQIKRLKAVK
jgi:arginyl-tRNA synthetase